MDPIPGTYFAWLPKELRIEIDRFNNRELRVAANKLAPRHKVPLIYDYDTFLTFLISIVYDMDRVYTINEILKLTPFRVGPIGSRFGRPLYISVLGTYRNKTNQIVHWAKWR